MSSEAETIYERVAKLEDEIALLRSEVDIIKKAFRNKSKRRRYRFYFRNDKKYKNKKLINDRIYCLSPLDQ